MERRVEGRDVGQRDRAPADAEELRLAAGGRATLVVVEGAGQALLPEQPEQVASSVLAWLTDIGSDGSGSEPALR